MVDDIRMGRKTFVSRKDQENTPVLRHPGLGDGVYEAIREQLMTLKIAPGARITVDNLARSLGVSQTPIREALVRLEAEELVVRTHLIGYSAAPLLTEHQLDEIYELRLLLEPYAAHKAARLIDDQAVEALGALSTDLLQPPGADSHMVYAQFARYDAEFHDRLAAASQSDLIRDTLGRLHSHTHTFRLVFHAVGKNQALEEHAGIVAALRAHDPEAAANATRQHVLQSQERFMSAFFARSST